MYSDPAHRSTHPAKHATMQLIMNQKPLSKTRIGVIGGRGAFGRWCVNLFESIGSEVRISDLATDLSNEELVDWASVVVLAVPIGVTAQVVSSISLQLDSEKLLVELTSVKTPFEGLLSELACEVLSLHPMFSPVVQSCDGQSCVVARYRSACAGDSVLALLRERGIALVEMSAEDHDRTMAVIQGLTHFQAIAAAHCFGALGFDLKKSLSVASPVYRLRLSMIGRIIAQDPRLYAEIQMYNPYVPAVIESLRNSSRLLEDLITRKDTTAFVAEFEQCKKALGDFQNEALVESNQLIEALKGSGGVKRGGGL